MSITGVDVGWIAAAISILGIVLNAKHNKLCWPVWIVSSLIWVCLAFVICDWPQVVLWSAFVVANFYGWKSWNRV